MGTIASGSMVGWCAVAGGELGKFQQKDAKGMHDATLTRGNIREELCLLACVAIAEALGLGR